VRAATRHRARPRGGRPKEPESTGFPGPDGQPVTDGTVAGRTPSTAWITDEWIERAIDVWSEVYGRPVTRDEAVEILVNLKRLVDVLLKARREMEAK
jgi:hypothetical protein